MRTDVCDKLFKMLSQVKSDLYSGESITVKHLDAVIMVLCELLCEAMSQSC